jgi:hypothetical protein
MLTNNLAMWSWSLPRPRPLLSGHAHLGMCWERMWSNFDLQNPRIVFQQTMQGVVGSKPCPAYVGRGRGRGRGLLPMPDAQGQISVGKTKAGDATVPLSSLELLDEQKIELLRRRRKLLKMLRQIERIEIKPTPLLEEEVVKVGKKQQVIDQLQQLEQAGIVDA